MKATVHLWNGCAVLPCAEGRGCPVRGDRDADTPIWGGVVSAERGRCRCRCGTFGGAIRASSHQA